MSSRFLTCLLVFFPLCPFKARKAPRPALRGPGPIGMPDGSSKPWRCWKGSWRIDPPPSSRIGSQRSRESSSR